VKKTPVVKVTQKSAFNDQLRQPAKPQEPKAMDELL